MGVEMGQSPDGAVAAAEGQLMTRDGSEAPADPP